MKKSLKYGLIGLAALRPLFDGRVETSGITFRDIALHVSEKAEGKAVYVVHIEFETQLKVRGEDIYLKEINLISSAFNAQGFVDIEGSGALKGEIKTSGLKGLTGATLIVGGTTESPRIYPSASSAIGGVIGGAMGGPAGAAVGSKVGGTVGDAVEGVGLMTLFKMMRAGNSSATLTNWYTEATGV